MGSTRGRLGCMYKRRHGTVEMVLLDIQREKAVYGEICLRHVTNLSRCVYIYRNGCVRSIFAAVPTNLRSCMCCIYIGNLFSYVMSIARTYTSLSWNIFLHVLLTMSTVYFSPNNLSDRHPDKRPFACFTVYLWGPVMYIYRYMYVYRFTVDGVRTCV